MKSKWIIGLMCGFVPFVSQAVELDDSRASNAAILFDFAVDNFDSARETVKRQVQLVKQKQLLDGDVRLDDEDTRIINSKLVLDDPNAFTSDKNLGGMSSICSSTDGFVIETWIANDQTIDIATENDIVYALGDVGSFVTLYQHYDQGPRYKLTVAGVSLMTPVDSLIAKKEQALRPQKVIVSVKNSGVAEIYLSLPDGESTRILPQGSLTFNKNNLPTTDLGLVVGNNFSPDFRLAENRPNNNSWRGSMYNWSLECGYASMQDITGMAEFRRSNDVVSIDINAEDTTQLRKAALLYGRIVGKKAPLDHPVVKAMAQKIAQGGATGSQAAALLAIEEDDFYNITVRDFAAEMSNREDTINVPLNDFVATLVGIVKDDRSAKLFLTGDEIYMGDKTKVPVLANELNDILTTNKHYEQLGQVNANLPKVLVPVKQKITNGRGQVIAHPDPAGLLTTRAFMSAHHLAGTGRRPVEYAFREFLCLPIDQIADTGTGDAMVMDNRIGRDIDRSPGGEPSKFDKNCKACHVPMDGFRGAFAYFSWRDNYVNYGPIVTAGAEFDGNGVATKFNENGNVYNRGWVTTDNNFKNYAIGKKNNAQIGWENPTDGKGIKDFGKQLSNTKAFPRCMAKRVYKSVCKREPVEFEDNFIEAKANEFVNNGYSMKRMFASVAASRECIGD